MHLRIALAIATFALVGAAPSAAFAKAEQQDIYEYTIDSKGERKEGQLKTEGTHKLHMGLSKVGCAASVKYSNRSISLLCHHESGLTFSTKATCEREAFEVRPIAISETGESQDQMVVMVSCFRGGT